MTAGQAGVASEMYPLLGSLLDRVADDDERLRVIGAMRVARWWSIACDRLDKAEAATADAGGFDISIEGAPALEAFNADLLIYYVFGSMVLDRLATVAVGGDADRAWERWLTVLDAGDDVPVRWNARQLDLDLRTVRNKLAVHIGDANGMTWGFSGPGLTTFGRFRFVGQGPSEAQLTGVTRLAQRLGIVLPTRDEMVEFPSSVVDRLRGHARVLDKAGREMYRHWAELWGLQSAPLNDVTWRVVELARFLEGGRASAAEPQPTR